MVILNDIWLYDKDNLKKYVDNEEIKLKTNSENKYFYYEIMEDIYPIECFGIIDKDVFMFRWRNNKYEFYVSNSIYNILNSMNIYFKEEKNIFFNENEYKNIIINLVKEYTIKNTKYIIDTNCFIDYLKLIENIIDNGYKIIIPTVVITELKGLSKSDDKLGNKASLVLKFIENNIKNITFSTSKGNIINNINFLNNETFVFNEQNNKLDVFILNTCENIDNNNSKIKKYLITNDINLKISAKTRGLKSIDIKGFLNQILI